MKKAADKGRKAVEKLASRLQQLKVEYVPAASLSPNTYNPNRQSDHEFLLLLRSIDEDGFTQPIIVHRQSRQIVDGEHRWTGMIVHQYVTRGGIVPLASVPEEEIHAARARRLEVLREIGDALVLPVVFVDMTPEQMRIATLRHNRARGSEDVELSAQVLRDLQEMGALQWAQDSLMLDDTEIQRLLQDIPAPEVLAAEQFSTAWAPGHEDTVEAQERERALARQQLRVYRVTLVFTGDEADLVRKVLGNRPAEALLVLCRMYLGQEGLGMGGPRTGGRAE